MATIGAALFAQVAHADDFPQWRCYYHDDTAAVDITAPCILRTQEIDGHFTYLMKIESHYVTIEYVDQNGPDLIWILNNKLAIGHEINREHVQGFTLDGSIRVEWQNRPNAVSQR